MDFCVCQKNKKKNNNNKKYNVCQKNKKNNNNNNKKYNEEIFSKLKQDFEFVKNYCI